MSNPRSGIHRAEPTARQPILARAARSLTSALTLALRPSAAAAPTPRQPRRIEAIVRDFKDRVNDYLSEALRLNSDADKASADMASLAKSSAMLVTDARLVSAAAVARAPSLAASLQTALCAGVNLSGRSERACSELKSASAAAQSASLSVDALQSRARDMGAISGFAEAVAAQANLLSLNATIEAARAGPAGRGFGVVAQEIKALAAAAAQAAARVATQVEAVQCAATTAGGMIDALEAAIDAAEGHTSAMSGALAELTRAAHENAVAAQSAAADSARFERRLADAANAADAAEVASARLRGFASGVSAQVSGLSASVEHFLRSAASG